MLSEFFNNAAAWLRISLALAAGAAAGLFLAWALFRLIKWYSKRRDLFLLSSVHLHLRKAVFWMAALLLALLAPPLFGIADDQWTGLALFLKMCLYIASGSILIQTTDVISDLVRRHYRLDVDDNLEERKIITQFQYIKRVVIALVFILVIAFTLLQFDKVRELGAGLLASAGVAGIIIGLAAQKSIANLLAGLQLAFTQPIRIDDVVIVEGEWGRIEEITLTYVVVKVWDERRLVVPLNYFNEQPFQNWTRSSSQLLGYVFLYTDYRMPVAVLRGQLTQLLEGHPLWDGRVNKIHVTNADRYTMEVRLLMSARNASDAFELRCEVREKIIAFIQKEYPDCLPRTRLEASGNGLIAGAASPKEIQHKGSRDPTG